MLMNYSVKRVQGNSETVDNSSPVCLHSEVWYFFLLTVAFFYYLMAVLSMIFTKESRRLREISLLHDNLIVAIMFPTLLEGVSITSKHLLMITIDIHPSPDMKIQVATCGLIKFLYSTFQTSSIIALGYLFYAQKCLLPDMNCIKPRPLCNIRLLAWQVLVGVTVATATTLIDASITKGSANGCCLHPVDTGSFEKTRDAIFRICNIYASYLLLRVSIDRFLKLLMIGHQRRPSTIINNRIQTF